MIIPVIPGMQGAKASSPKLISHTPQNYAFIFLQIHHIWRKGSESWMIILWCWEKCPFEQANKSTTFLGITQWIPKRQKNRSPLLTNVTIRKEMICTFYTSLTHTTLIHNYITLPPSCRWMRVGHQHFMTSLMLCFCNCLQGKWMYNLYTLLASLHNSLVLIKLTILRFLKFSIVRNLFGFNLFYFSAGEWSGKSLLGPICIKGFWGRVLL